MSSMPASMQKIPYGPCKDFASIAELGPRRTRSWLAPSSASTLCAHKGRFPLNLTKPAPVSAASGACWASVQDHERHSAQPCALFECRPSDILSLDLPRPRLHSKQQFCFADCQEPYRRCSRAFGLSSSGRPATAVYLFTREVAIGPAEPCSVPESNFIGASFQISIMHGSTEGARSTTDEHIN
jgi:hypothetical protein